MKDRFDLENEIMGCWNITDDLYKLAEHVDNGTFSSLSAEDTDELASIVMGLRSVYDMRFKLMFETFAQCIPELKNDPRIPNELGQSGRLNDVTPQEWDRVSKRFYQEIK